MRVYLANRIFSGIDNYSTNRVFSTRRIFSEKEEEAGMTKILGLLC
jgi:hypothetical protein